jgi:penicillin-binding protein A
VEGVSAEQGQPTLAFQPGILSPALSPEVAATLRAALARPADSATSPADTPLIGRSGTTELGPGVEPHSWFIGLSPAVAPRYAIAVLIENGGPDESVALIVARSLVKALLPQ